MNYLTKLTAVGLAIVILSGCAGKRIRLDPNDPLFGYKNEFSSQYEFYFLENDWETLRSLLTIDEVDKFKENFLKVRDTDPRTPENEWKTRVDGWLTEIENEVLFSDNDVTGVRFDGNGGLRGDMAHVYLLYGMPHFKARLPEGTYHTEMMVWYYFGPRGKPLMRFLFYKQRGIGTFKLYRTHNSLAFNNLFDPHSSPLVEFSNQVITDPQGVADLWYEIQRKDVAVVASGYSELVFITSIFEFSSYPDVVIEGGDGKKKFGALDVPEPAAMTAERFKPNILGQPTVPEGVELFENGYHSFLPAYFRSIAEKNNQTSLMITILRKNADWRKQENEQKPYATSFQLRISFQNKKTRKLTEFVTAPKFELTQAEFDRKDERGDLVGVIAILPSIYQYYDGEKFGPTFGETLKSLEPGEYVVNVDLRHSITKKYNSWREEITIK